MSTTAVSDQVRTVVAEAVTPLGLLIDEVTVTPVGKRRLVRVAVDTDLDRLEVAGADTVIPPLTLDEVAEATRAISAALDETDVMGAQPYVLEVGSPGTDRPLTEPRHFRRNVGRLVAITSPTGKVTGRIAAVDADGVDLTVPAAGKAPERTERLTYGEISKARIQVEFSRLDDDDDEGEDD